MRSRSVLALTSLSGALVAGCSPAAPALDPPARAVTGADLASELLAAHNHERRAMGVPLLEWDPGLADGAAVHARHLAATGSLRHSSQTARPGEGENLWMGTRGGYSTRQMAASWASEKAHFRPGVFPAVSRTGNWSDVGHYTQMIWPATARLGCAVGRGARFDVLVCRYAPAGNVVGQPVG